MTAVDSGLGLADLLEPCEQEVTGLLAVTLTDGRDAELWLDHGRVSYLSCAGIPSLEDRLADVLAEGRWDEVVRRAENGSGLVVELVRVGVDLDTIRERLCDLGREVVAELDGVGISAIEIAESDHQYRGSGWVDLPAVARSRANGSAAESPSPTVDQPSPLGSPSADPEPTPVGPSSTADVSSAPDGPSAPDHVAPASVERLVAVPMPDEVGEIRLDASRWAVSLALATPGSVDEVAGRTGLPVAQVDDAMQRLRRIGLLRAAEEGEGPAPTGSQAASPTAAVDEESAYTSSALRHLIEGVRAL